MFSLKTNRHGPPPCFHRCCCNFHVQARRRRSPDAGAREAAAKTPKAAERPQRRLGRGDASSGSDAAPLRGISRQAGEPSPQVLTHSQTDADVDKENEEEKEEEEEERDALGALAIGLTQTHEEPVVAGPSPSPPPPPPASSDALRDGEASGRDDQSDGGNLADVVNDTIHGKADHGAGAEGGGGKQEEEEDDDDDDTDEELAATQQEVGSTVPAPAPPVAGLTGRGAGGAEGGTAVAATREEGTPPGSVHAARGDEPSTASVPNKAVHGSEAGDGEGEDSSVEEEEPEKEEPEEEEEDDDDEGGDDGQLEELPATQMDMNGAGAEDLVPTQVQESTPAADMWCNQESGGEESGDAGGSGRGEEDRDREDASDSGNEDLACDDLTAADQDHAGYSGGGEDDAQNEAAGRRHHIEEEEEEDEVLPDAKLAWEFLEKVKDWKKATRGKGHRLVGPEEGSAPMMQDQVGPFFLGFGSENGREGNPTFVILSTCGFSVGRWFDWVAGGHVVFVGFCCCCDGRYFLVFWCETTCIGLAGALHSMFLRTSKPPLKAPAK